MIANRTNSYRILAVKPALPPEPVRTRDADHAALSATEREDVDAVLRGDLPLECVEQRCRVFLWRHHAKELES